MPNINDISKKTGFSKSTVSRYLNDGPVSKTTSKIIKKAIKDLGYEPNIYARSLKLSKTKTIGVIIPNFVGFSKNISLNSINSYLNKTDYRMIISCADDNMKKEVQLIESMIRLNVDGIILFASDITRKHKKIFSTLRIPIVIIGQVVKNEYCIVHDDYKAGTLIANYIKDSKHKEITFFGIGDYDQAVYNRFKGLEEALSDTDIMINHHLVDFKMETTYDLIQEIFDKEDSTFYIGATDNIAYGIIKGLNKLGINYPKDISVSGFGDYPTSQLLNPDLTTVHFDYDKIGSSAIELLLNLINGESDIVGKHQIHDCKLVIRNSTKIE